MADNGGGKNKKYGRNKVSAARYEREGRLEKNKARNHMRRNRRMGLPENYMKNLTPAGGAPHPRPFSWA